MQSTGTGRSSHRSTGSRNRPRLIWRSAIDPADAGGHDSAGVECFSCGLNLD
jgi:hypothetical protein